LGSPRLTTDHTGRILSRTNYAPFGQTVSRSKRAGRAEPVGYTGHRPVGDTGLIDMLARHYDPELARMLSADTILPDFTNPQALNRYGYAYNNPITYTDPTGHEPELKPIVGEAQFLLRWNEFVWRSQQHHQGNVAAALGPTVNVQELSVSAKEIKAADPQTTPTNTPALQPATVGTGSNAGTGGSGAAGTVAAPQPSTQIPQTGTNSGSSSQQGQSDNALIEPGALVHPEIIVRPPAWWTEQFEGCAVGCQLAQGVADRTRRLERGVGIVAGTYAGVAVVASVGPAVAVRIAPLAVAVAAKSKVLLKAGKAAISTKQRTSRLPPEAQNTLANIQKGGPFPYKQDGTVFQNREGLLPKQPPGYYREYTVPTPGATNRGAQRLLTGKNGEVYYTSDHYRTFSRVQ
jgi:ribonuclease T1